MAAERTIPVNDDLPSIQSAFVPVPTTKILAIGNFPVPLTAEQRKALGHREVSDTVRLYLAGRIDQWWYRQDGQGVVFLLNLTSTEEAKALVESLPFGRAGLLKFDLMPLGPLAPLQILVRDGGNANEKTEEI